MSRESEEYRAAAQASRAARHRFLDNLADTRARFEPDRLKRDIGDAAKRQAEIAKMKAEDMAREHPVAIGAAAAGLIAWLFRRPIAALSRLLGVKAANAWRTRNERRQDDADQEES